MKTTYRIERKSIGAGIVAGTFLLLSSLSFAEPPAIVEKRNSQASDLASMLCESALVSKSELRKKAREMKVSKRQLKSLECNDMPALAFAEYHEDERALERVRNLANIE